ncbi:FAD dependent oxidoreductase, partial [Aspergillus sclerotialis]
MEVAIIGSGIIGLLSALTLSEAGYKVTIIARDLPGDESHDWASPWAGAAIFPHPDASGQDLQTETFRHYWELAQRDQCCGVQVVKATEYYDDRETDTSIWYKNIVPQYHRIPTSSLPSGAKLGIEYQTLTVNPEIYLPRLKSALQNHGVRFIRQEISSIEEAKQLTGCNIVVNASGLGAAHLANDNQVIPVRGQTMFAETSFNELVMYQGSHYSYAIPRMGSGGVILGGVSQEGNTDKSVDNALRGDILNR